MTGLEASGILLGLGLVVIIFGLVLSSDFWGNVCLGVGVVCCLPLFLRLWVYVMVG